jgi:hypothetical protein
MLILIPTIKFYYIYFQEIIQCHIILMCSKNKSLDPLYIRHIYQLPYPHRSDIQRTSNTFFNTINLFNRLIKMARTHVFLLLAFIVLLSSISLPIHKLQLYILIMGVFGWLQADTVAAVWTAAAAIHREKNTVEAAAAAGLQPQQAAANKLNVLHALAPIISLLLWSYSTSVVTTVVLIKKTSC